MRCCFDRKGNLGGNGFSLCTPEDTWVNVSGGCLHTSYDEHVMRTLILVEV